jgi:hypothetical protein
MKQPFNSPDNLVKLRLYSGLRDKEKDRNIIRVLSAQYVGDVSVFNSFSR